MGKLRPREEKGLVQGDTVNKREEKKKGRNWSSSQLLSLKHGVRAGVGYTGSQPSLPHGKHHTRGLKGTVQLWSGDRTEAGLGIAGCHLRPPPRTPGATATHQQCLVGQPQRAVAS